MNGKSIWIWRVKNILGGDPKSIAKRAKEMNLKQVFVKAADGAMRFNLRPPLWLDNIIGPLMDELNLVGIATYGWQYIYGDYPEQEAQRALDRIAKYHFAGWIVDAEGEFDNSSKSMAGPAERYMTTLRAGLPADYLVGLSTYRYPSVHQSFPWNKFLTAVDFYAPQVYWVEAHNPSFQLEKSLAEYRSLEKRIGIGNKPYYPTGAAYSDKPDVWKPTPDDIRQFHAKALDLGLQSVSYWEWSDAILLSLEQTITALTWPTNDPPTWAESIDAWARTHGYDGPGVDA